MNEDLLEIITKEKPSFWLKKRLLPIFESQHSVRDIVLLGLKIDSYDLSVLLKIMNKRKESIESFALRGNDRLTDENMLPVINCLQEMPKLQALWLDIVNLEDSGVTALTKLIQQQPNLYSVQLRIDNLHNSAIGLLTNAIAQNQKITRFTIHVNHIDELSLQEIVSLLRNDRFYEADFGCELINQEGCRLLGQSLKSLRSLKTFGLNVNKIADLNNIMDGLSVNPFIQQIFIMNRHCQDYEICQSKIEAICARNHQLAKQQKKSYQTCINDDKDMKNLAEQSSNNKEEKSSSMKSSEISDFNYTGGFIEQEKQRFSEAWCTAYKMTNLVFRSIEKYTEEELSRINAFIKWFGEISDSTMMNEVRDNFRKANEFLKDIPKRMLTIYKTGEYEQSAQDDDRVKGENLGDGFYKFSIHDAFFKPIYQCRPDSLIKSIFYLIINPIKKVELSPKWSRSDKHEWTRPDKHERYYAETLARRNPIIATSEAKNYKFFIRDMYDALDALTEQPKKEEEVIQPKIDASPEQKTDTLIVNTSVISDAGISDIAQEEHINELMNQLQIHLFSLNSPQYDQVKNKFSFMFDEVSAKRNERDLDIMHSHLQSPKI